jgi:hypothetical protein
LDARERDADPSSRTERGAPQICDEFGDLVVAQTLSGERRRLRRRRIGDGLDDERSRAVASEGLD